MDDIFEESELYREWRDKVRAEGLTKGLVEGQAKGRLEGELQASRSILIRYVQTRFPQLASLTRKRSRAIKDPERLQAMIAELFGAQSMQEASHMLGETGETSNQPS